ncbi:hypothetical protein KY362_06285 [Candidatus Woesearchaeota archaeon]|nr:hypothetical protein [Candidatus Woesearchaeota archaeon]
MNFVPNYEYVITYSISAPKPFEFYTEGAFSEFTRIETVSHTDNRGQFKVFLKLPEDYERPGKHRMYVVAKEKPQRGVVNTVAAIRGFIEIDVPFPGHYAELYLHVNDVNEGDPIYMTADVLNKGKLNISDAVLDLDIVSGGRSIRNKESESFSLEPNGGYSFEWDLLGGELKPGTYTLAGHLDYEGKTKDEEEGFRVGTFDVAITNYTREMYNNSVNLFEITVESLWNDRMDTVYMDLTIHDGKDSLSTVKTPPFNLLPWQKKVSSLYWNTAGVPIGEFDLLIDLYYDEGKRSEKRKINIVEKVPVVSETPFPTSTVVLVIIAIIIIIFNLYFILSRRRNDKEEERRKEDKVGGKG